MLTDLVSLADARRTLVGLRRERRQRPRRRIAIDDLDYNSTPGASDLAGPAATIELRTYL